MPGARRRVDVIGAGQVGSRHLQALKLVRERLDIRVIDPSSESLRRARERWEAAGPPIADHRVEYFERVQKAPDGVDLAIVATTSAERRSAIERALDAGPVRYFLLEKVLFQRAADYAAVRELLVQAGSRAWVNCVMRVMPFYGWVRTEFTGQRLAYHVTGSHVGLGTSAIHYLDHMAYLTDCYDCAVDTGDLDQRCVPSKRAGLLELTGTLTVRFADGSLGSFTSFPSGRAPIAIIIDSAETRCVVRESEGLAWISTSNGDWKWREVEARIPLQSEITRDLAEKILGEGTCPLTPYEQSMRLHLKLLEPLLAFVNAAGSEAYDYYPFT